MDSIVFGFIVFGFILGTILGSLVKALADRSLENKSFWGRSYCPHCKKKLQWYDLLPVVSYIMLRGKCRYCEDRISLEYLIVEVVMGLLVAFLFWQAFNFDLIYKIFFVTVLAIVFLTDFKKMLIPDRVIIPAIRLSIIFITFITIIKVDAEPLLSGILMGLLISGFFLALIFITGGKGMGGGDVKLGAFMGLGLGFPNSLLALMLAFLTGAIWALGEIILGRKKFGQHIAFGPFLVTGSLIALFWGNKIVDWYLKLGS